MKGLNVENNVVCFCPKKQATDRLFFVLLSDDFNRVVLDPEDGNIDTDYVNASYVDVSIYLFMSLYITISI